MTDFIKKIMQAVFNGLIWLFTFFERELGWDAFWSYVLASMIILFIAVCIVALITKIINWLKP